MSRIDMIVTIGLVLVVLVIFATSSSSDDGEGEGGKGSGPEYGVCGNVKFITNTFREEPTTAKICSKLTGSEDQCLDANVKTWGPTCADVEFKSADGMLYRAGGCAKFAERRGDGTYRQCQHTAPFSTTCAASPDPCDVPSFVQPTDAVVNLYPCTQKKIGGGFYGPRGVDECENIDLPDGASCDDYVEKSIRVFAPDDTSLLASRNRAEVQLWTRCEAAGEAGKCRASTSKCARLQDMPVV